MATTNFNNDIIITETLIVSSSVGIGGTPPSTYSLAVAKNMTGGTNVYGIGSYGTVQSDATNSANAFISGLVTAATSFTLTNYRHFYANQGTIGAGSSVTNQMGFFVDSNLIGATNNFGFRSIIPSGTNRWNLYMDGTADNYLAGALGIGSTNLTGINLRITKNITGLTTSYGILQDPTIQSGVTTATYMNRSLPSTVAASFTLSNLYHFAATQGTIGAGSTVTNQYGFLAESNLTGATNNYGFFGNIPASTGDWNLFMNGNADNFLSGSLGIGNGKSVPTAKLDINGNTLISGSLIVSSSAVAASLQGSGSGVFTVDGTVGRLFSVDDSLTGSLFSVNTSAGLPVIEAFSNNTVRIGQYGQQVFYVSQSRVGIGKENALNGILDVSGSTTLTGSLSTTSTATFSSNVGIGTTSLGSSSLVVSKTLTGGTSRYGILQNGQVQSDVTTLAIGLYNQSNTAASAFTLASYVHLLMQQGTIGATSAITDQFGVFIDSTLTGATNNYGIYSSLAAGTGRWNLYFAGTANNFIAGNLGIGTTSLTGRSLSVTKNITGAVTSYGILSNGTIQSDVTNAVRLFNSVAVTAAASFTLSSLVHYYAEQSTIGAGSAVTNQYGFYAESNLIGATNDYGFYGNLAAASNVWNLYMAGTAANYLAGALGIGSTSLTAINLRISKSITGGGTGSAISADGTVQSDVSFLYNIKSQPSTAAATFTITDLAHFSAQGISSQGAGSTITNQIGFQATGLTQGTNNYGFYGNIASGTNRWNLYMAGTADNYLAGALGIGSTSLTAINLRIGKTITGATTGYGVIQQGIVQSDVTSTAYGYYNEIGTQAASFTLTNYRHFFATASTIGAGSTVTNQVGFFVSTTLTGATNNYAFYSDLASGSANNWNLYMNGGAPNYLSGSLGIGNTSLTGWSLRVGRNMTGATSAYGISSEGSVQSDVTTQARGYNTFIGTQATTFTLPTLFHYFASQGTFGAGSTVTNQHGFSVDSGLTGATNNFAFFSNLAAGSGRWNLYMNGTANNFMAGNLGIGTTAVDTSIFRVLKNLTSTAPTAISVGGEIQSTSTGQNNYISTNATTAAASFTVGAIRHINIQQGTFGAGSTVTDQYGVIVGASMVGGASNFAFYGDLPSGTNRWNLYMNGTANNYLAGALGIGGTSLSNTNLTFNKTITGAVTSYGIFGTSIVGADVTTSARYYATSVSTAASAFTLTDLVHYYAGQGTFGATSTVTNQYGFFVQSSLQSATNNYGFYGNIPSGANRWNLYMAGTAANYMAGTLSIGTTASTRTVDILGAVGINTVLKLEGGSSSTQTYLQLAYNGATNAQSGYIGYDTSSNLILYTANTERLRVNSVGVIVTGSISATADITAYSTSDINFKENIQYIPNALEKLDKIGGYTFDWKNDEELVSLHNFRGHDIGVIAQEIEEVLPEIVATRDNGYKAVKYEKLTAFLIQVVKELKADNEDLRNKINELKNK